MRKRKVRVEDFRKWFANPEAELQAFLVSERAIMNIVFMDGNKQRAVELSQRDAAQLLEELQKEIR